MGLSICEAKQTQTTAEAHSFAVHGFSSFRFRPSRHLAGDGKNAEEKHGENGDRMVIQWWDDDDDGDDDDDHYDDDDDDDDDDDMGYNQQSGSIWGNLENRDADLLNWTRNPSLLSNISELGGGSHSGKPLMEANELGFGTWWQLFMRLPLRIIINNDVVPLSPWPRSLRHCSRGGRCRVRDWLRTLLDGAEKCGMGNAVRVEVINGIASGSCRCRLDSRTASQFSADRCCHECAQLVRLRFQVWKSLGIFSFRSGSAFSHTLLMIAKSCSSW